LCGLSNGFHPKNSLHGAPRNPLLPARGIEAPPLQLEPWTSLRTKPPGTVLGTAAPFWAPFGALENPPRVERHRMRCCFVVVVVVVAVGVVVVVVDDGASVALLLFVLMMMLLFSIA